MKCPRCGKAYLARPTFDGQVGDTPRAHPSPSENPFPTLPAEFGRYRVLKLLGRGGMGAVFLAEDSQLGRRVALKIPFFDAKASPQRLERFAREARSAAGLAHPNICTVYDTGEIGGRPFLTMRYVQGTSLEAEIERDEGVPQARAAEVARQVALALDFAHRAGVVHRDLKPANVMVAAGGEPVVMDFGLAKLLADADPNEAKLTRDGGVIGTPSYMAPEQIRGDAAAIGPASDVYSLGVMLFELLTGETPYRGSVGVVMGQALAAPVRSVWELRPDADPRLEAACRKAMAKEPAARFATMAAFAEALDRYLKSPQTPAPETASAAELTPFGQMVSAPAPARPTPRKRRVAGLALAVVLVLAAAGAAAAVVLRLETKGGALLVEIDDPEVEARFKGGTLTLCGPDGKVRYTLSAGERDKKLPAGAYTVRVEGADGLTLDTPEFTLKRGERVTVKVTLERPAVAKRASAAAEAGGAEYDDLGLPRAPRVVADGKWVALFNGKDLTGWSSEKGGAGNWGVVDGAITCAGPIDILYSERSDFGDFHLRAEAKVNRQGNSGIHFRSPKPLDVRTDYELNIWAVPEQQKFGSLWGLVPGTDAFVPPDTWVTFEVVAAGQRIRALMNGQETANFVETRPDRRPSGHLGLQHWDAGTKAFFRKIEVKLPSGNAAQGVASTPPAPQLPTAPPAAAADPDRKAAEYVLSVGGKVWVNGKQEAKALADLPKGRFDLTAVWLRDCQKLTEAGLAACAGVTKVRHLDLVNTPVTEGGLANFKDCSGISILDLNNTATTDAGLAHFHNCKRVNSLWLGGTRVTDKGLAGFAGCRWVVQLDLRDTGATDAALANFKGCANLWFLNLDGTKVTDAALAAAKGFPKLTGVNLLRTATTAKAVAELRDALPDCKVAWDGPAPAAPKAQADPFQTGSVWLDDTATTTLTVTERKGETFRARLVIAAGIDRNVTGTVKAGKVAWLAKDVQATKGRPGGDNEGTMSQGPKGDVIDFTWRVGGGQTGEFQLRLQANP